MLVGFQHLAANRDVPQHETSSVGGTETTSTSLCHWVLFQASATSTIWGWLRNQSWTYARIKRLVRCRLMHIYSSSCFPGEHGSYFCSSLKALEIEGIWHFWGLIEDKVWSGWPFASHRAHEPRRRLSVQAMEGSIKTRDKVNNTSSEQIQMSVSVCTLIWLHIWWHVHFHAFLLSLFCLIVWANIINNLKIWIV